MLLLLNFHVFKTVHSVNNVLQTWQTCKSLLVKTTFQGYQPVVIS